MVKHSDSQLETHCSHIYLHTRVLGYRHQRLTKCAAQYKIPVYIHSEWRSVLPSCGEIQTIRTGTVMLQMIIQETEEYLISLLFTKVWLKQLIYIRPASLTQAFISAISKNVENIIQADRKKQQLHQHHLRTHFLVTVACSIHKWVQWWVYSLPTPMTCSCRGHFLKVGCICLRKAM